MSRLLALFGPGLVLTDGATATELQKRGLAIGQPSDGWNLTHPEAVRMVAASYVEAGADVLLTNTFRSNPISLADVGLAARVREINRRGVELARAAAESRPAVRVFGSIGPIGRSDARRVFEAFRGQGDALAEAGIDALVLETFTDLEEIERALAAVVPLGLPVVASLARVFDENAEYEGKPLQPEQAAARLEAAGAAAVGVNCVSVESAKVAVHLLRAAASLPIWAKPNAGLPIERDGSWCYPDAPGHLADGLRGLVQTGATFVGGCCGIGPEVIRGVKSRGVSAP